MVKWATKYVGIPFVAHGRTAEGLDCWGLVKIIYRDELGVELPDYLDDYDNTESSTQLGPVVSNAVNTLWNLVPVPQSKVGHVVVFRVKGHPSHVGLLVGDNKFIHCETGIGTAIERLSSFRWSKRLLGVYEYASH